MAATKLEEKYGPLTLAVNQPDSSLSMHLDYIRFLIEPYGGELKAQFLLSDFTSTVWDMTNGIKTRRNRDGAWVGTQKVNWNIRLSDGTSLIDIQNRTLLDACRKAIFFFRLGLSDGEPPSVTSSVLFNGTVIQLARWLVLNKDIYNPALFGFSLLDQQGLNRLFSDIARGGWTCALRYEERLITTLYEKAQGHEIPIELLQNITELPSEVRENICTWIEKNNGYIKVSNGDSRKVLNINFIADLIFADRKSLNSNTHFRATVRQFEPDFYHPSLLLSTCKKRNYPSHKTPLITEAQKRSISETAFKSYKTCLNNLFRLHRHMPTQLPNPSSINLLEASSFARNHLKSAGHTPFIPVDIGFKYLNEALRWVILYGDELIEYYLAVLYKIKKYRDTSSAKKAWTQIISQQCHKCMRETPHPQALKNDGIFFHRWSDKGHDISFQERSSQYRKTKQFKIKIKDNGISLLSSIDVLRGAALIIIGILKPSRVSEISTIKYDCLLDSGNGRYWLDSELSKRTMGEYKATTEGMPIPVIAAKAIQQMQKLSKGLKEIYDETDSFRLSLLFYKGITDNSDSSRVCINSYLDRFCDHTGVELDNQGRRWYIRIHEMRKWFLLLLFWNGRYDVIDAARWVAGHTNAEHLYSYIEREFPSEQLGSLEAEYTIDMLKLVEYKSHGTSDDSLENLRQKVVQHFKVSSLKLIEERKWENYIKTLFEDEYYLEPYTAKKSDGTEIIEIAIKSGKRKKINV